eukprot:CAMPEP_0197931546 /NCGR_PEP_ID=MMETSP1439-20131203/107254_1 /TAXON_ID=66791 /ORGANISM="Gonyaulax spinifera, Strain CCMP409" /LENGTH=39 /DNA_ID= /DNA_START= /DNA_END= /DNA_ORIENTATION=
MSFWRLEIRNQQCRFAMEKFPDAEVQGQAVLPASDHAAL